MTSRLLWVGIMQSLYDDPCLLPLLDREEDTSHGSLAFCDEPESTHSGRPVRREQQGWPSDFARAVVTVGRLNRSPLSPVHRPWFESWTFVVSGFARSTVKLNNGSPGGPGDLWLADVYDHVVRILGQTEDPMGCDAGFAVTTRRHEADPLPLQWNDEHRFWWFQARFRWLILSRGQAVVPCVPCGTV